MSFDTYDQLRMVLNICSEKCFIFGLTFLAVDIVGGDIIALIKPTIKPDGIGHEITTSLSVGRIFEHESGKKI